ncbi:histone family protein DNA-binding protein [Sulfobacillus acidophilus TPY]|nr:histone family protein DNA-binding protein [Sulfobacillus acidophilus TPY]MCY0864910.1 HU family DNA-binding protein [Sulfobacillus sp.]
MWIRILFARLRRDGFLNKAELISEVAERAGMTKKDAERAVNAVVESIEAALTKGDRVSLVGFGTFEVRERAARVGRNPRTGATLEISSSRVPAFKAGKALKESVAK